MKQNFWLLVVTIVAVIASCDTKNEKIDQEISSNNAIQKLEELTGLKWKSVDLDTMKIKPGYIPYDSLVIWAQNQHNEVISRVDTPLTYDYSLVRWKRKGGIAILSTEIFQLSYKFPAKINFELNLKTENGTTEYYLNAKFNFESLYSPTLEVDYLNHMVLDLLNKNTLILTKNSVSHLMYTSLVIVV